MRLNFWPVGNIAHYNFYPWKDIVGKKVLMLRYIAKLRAFYSIISKHIVEGSGSRV
jgi:hypothetical protein